MFILSVCRKNYQIDEKNMWLDKNAPFFERNNRCILSKEETQDASSANMKLQFLKNCIIKENEKIVFVDFKRFNSVIEYLRIRKLKNDPVAVCCHNDFAQVNADTGSIAVTDGGCTDGAQDDYVGLGFKNAFFINGGNFEPLA